MKRKLTQKPVAKMTQAGAPAKIKGKAANWELPAYTSSVMAMASNTLKPELTMATPVIKPQAATPGAWGAKSRTASLNAG
jgi:hypothetical protein